MPRRVGWVSGLREDWKVSATRLDALAVVIQSHVHRYDFHACCSLMGVLCPTGIVPRQEQQAFIPIAPDVPSLRADQFVVGDNEDLEIRVFD